MTNEKELAGKIRGYLDQSTGQLRQGTAYRLQQARAKALSHVAQTQTVGQLSLAGAHGGGGTSHSTSGSSRRFWSNRALWAGIILILASGVAFQQWRSAQTYKDIEETDAAILSSDLPIDAYLDRGFQNWLKSNDD